MSKGYPGGLRRLAQENLGAVQVALRRRLCAGCRDRDIIDPALVAAIDPYRLKYGI